jgi:predicted extracellular nuclease
MKKVPLFDNKICLLLLIIFFAVPVFSQTESVELFSGFDDRPRGNQGVRVAFYNVENLFNTTHDSLKNDKDFLPDGNYNWNTYRYWQKQHKLAKAISAIGGWEPPEIVGLCEVENKHVLLNLVNNTSLEQHKYRIIHHESPDRRGIDVAMIYRPEKVEIIEEKAIPLVFPFDTASKTRDILYVKAKILYSDTVIMFFNHWPSRYGGQFQTETKRIYAAHLLKKITDSIAKQNPCAKILIIGDLNDHPSDKSLKEGLEVKNPAVYTRKGLLDLMIPYEELREGSHYYNGETGGSWNVLDHIIVSKSLLWDCDGIYVKDSKAFIFKAPFLMETNAAGISVPFRTYIGMKYNGGFADHLPVYVDLFLKKSQQINENP